VLSPWKTVTPINTATWTLERNPYSVFVDTAGNQLPYIDKVVLTLAENLEVSTCARSPVSTTMRRGTRPRQAAVFIENQQKGNYKVHLDPGDYCDLIIKFNLNYDADRGDREVVQHRRLPARALARHQPRSDQRDVLARYGHAGSVVPVDTNKYNPGPQYRNLWSTLDVKKANEMLDKIGLAKKDAEGYRLRADGKGRLRIEIMTLGGQFVQYTQISEMIREQWKKIGIDLRCRRSSAASRSSAPPATSSSSRPGTTTAASTSSPSRPTCSPTRSTTSPPPGRSTRSGSAPPGHRARSPSRG
jgi:peptide/nickel transport system substrate-binding protein